MTLSAAAAKALHAQAPLVRTVSRGVLKVKGKGLMELFFLDTEQSPALCGGVHELGIQRT